MATKEEMNSINKAARIGETSPLIYARVAAFLYLVMLPFAIFGTFYYIPSLIVPGDAATTANNIMASESLFRLSNVSALIVQIGHILLVLVLYKLLKPASRNVALLMVIFQLVGIPIAMLNQLNQLAALLLLSGADYLTAFGADQLQALVLFFLNLHEHGQLVAVIFWGLWLFPYGYLVFKSGYLPRILGVLLIIGGFWLSDGFLFIPSFTQLRKLRSNTSPGNLPSDVSWGIPITLVAFDYRCKRRRVGRTCS